MSVVSAIKSMFTARAAAPIPPPVTGDAKPVPPLYTVVRPGARDRWLGSVARSYDPQRIELILRGALNGDLTAQWELFDLMEDTAPRIKKNLNRLKRAVIARNRKLLAWTEDDEPATPEAEQRAKVASNALWKMRPRADENQNGFDQTIYDILDAWAKGIAVLEVNWETRESGKLGKINAPQSTHYIHPRFYGYPTEGDWLGLNVTEINSAKAKMWPLGSFEGDPNPKLELTPVDGIYARFPENKFLICVCKTKSGHPAGSALLRALAFWWCAANFTQEWFLNFAQLFGVPIRWANYDPNTPGLVESILDMLENMGSAAYGAFPTGTTLEVKEPAKAGTDNPQIALMDRFERHCDFLILGQSGTTEVAGPGKSGGSFAANKVLEGVEEEIVDSACGFVETVFDQQLLPMINRLNYSDELLCPELCLEPELVEDAKALIENYGTAVRAGALTPNTEDEKHLRQRLNLPAMNKDVEREWKKQGGARSPITIQNETVVEPVRPGSGNPVHAHARAQSEATEQLVNNTLESLTGVQAKWLGDVKPFFHRLVALAQSGEVSDAEFIQALAKAQKQMPELFGKLKPEAIEEAMYDSMSAATVNGALTGAVQRRKAVA